MMLLSPERVVSMSHRNSYAVRKSTKIDTLLGSVPTTGLFRGAWKQFKAHKCITDALQHILGVFHSANVSFNIEQNCVRSATLRKSCCWRCVTESAFELSRQNCTVSS